MIAHSLAGAHIGLRIIEERTVRTVGRWTVCIGAFLLSARVAEGVGDSADPEEAKNLERELCNKINRGEARGGARAQSAPTREATDCDGELPPLFLILRGSSLAPFPLSSASSTQPPEFTAPEWKVLPPGLDCVCEERWTYPSDSIFRTQVYSIDVTLKSFLQSIPLRQIVFFSNSNYCPGNNFF